MPNGRDCMQNDVERVLGFTSEKWWREKNPSGRELEGLGEQGWKVWNSADLLPVRGRRIRRKLPMSRTGRPWADRLQD